MTELDLDRDISQCGDDHINITNNIHNPQTVDIHISEKSNQSSLKFT